MLNLTNRLDAPRLVHGLEAHSDVLTRQIEAL
jgi:hypothetical protein